MRDSSAASSEFSLSLKRFSFPLFFAFFFVLTMDSEPIEPEILFKMLLNEAFPW